MKGVSVGPRQGGSSEGKAGSSLGKDDAGGTVEFAGRLAGGKDGVSAGVSKRTSTGGVEISSA